MAAATGGIGLDVGDAAAGKGNDREGFCVERTGGGEAEIALIGEEGGGKIGVEEVGEVGGRGREVAEAVKVGFQVREEGVVVTGVTAGEVLKEAPWVGREGEGEGEGKRGETDEEEGCC